MGPEHDPQAPAQLPAAAEPAAPLASPDAAAPLAALLRGAAPSSLTPGQVMALQRGAGNASVARLLRELAPPAVRPGATAAGLLVADDVPAPPGHMRLSEFLDRVEREVSSVAERELAASVYTAAGCPWIAHWIGYYRGRPPGEVEAAIRNYAPAIAAARTVEAQVAAIGARVSEGIRVWSQTGEVPQPPPDSPGAPPGWTADIQPTPAASAGVARSAASERTRLGPGRPLDGSVAGRMGAALGADLSRVRVHADSAGAALATRRGALATAVGEHVAFAPGAYAPGTPVGDALLAHELAHTVQQAGAPEGERAAEHASEADADRAAVGTMAALW